MNGPWTLFWSALDIKDSKTVNTRSGEQLVFGLISQTPISLRLVHIYNIQKKENSKLPFWPVLFCLYIKTGYGLTFSLFSHFIWRALPINTFASNANGFIINTRNTHKCQHPQVYPNTFALQANPNTACLWVLT